MNSSDLAKGMMRADVSSWPKLPPEAMYGLAGEIVKRIEPHTEADPAALLTQLLTVFGAAAGRAAHFHADGSKHFPNLFMVLVGATAKGRKGTSWAHIERVFRAVDDEWFSRCCVSGLSSGEGLICAVRDPLYQTEQVKRGSPETHEVLVHAGVDDKRLLVHESEFTAVLQQQQRSGNILSVVIRQAWESGNLRTLVKTLPLRATDAHISIIGHITAEELERNLDKTERANGFANRFLWVYVRRSKLLPRGGGVPDLADCVDRLRSALNFARSAGEIKRDEHAEALWEQEYAQLSEGRAGLIGAITSRSEAQVMRLAMLYALVGGESTIRREHLQAALALWDYCEASVEYVFGAGSGDPIADRILQRLRESPAGLTRTKISNLFGGHQKPDRIESALGTLRNQAAAHCRDESTGGRKAERWFAGPAPAQNAQDAQEVTP